jgi:hypothetical protein
MDSITHQAIGTATAQELFKTKRFKIEPNKAPWKP